MTLDGMIEDFARREARAWGRIATAMEMRVTPAPGMTADGVHDQTRAALREPGRSTPGVACAGSLNPDRDRRVRETVDACLDAAKLAAENGDAAKAESFARAARVLMG